MLRCSSAFAAVMVIPESAVHGLRHLHPWAFLSMALFVGGLHRWALKKQDVAGPGLVFLLFMFTVFTGFEYLTPGSAEGLRVATYAYPVLAVFLLGRRWGLAFLALGLTTSSLSAVGTLGEPEGLRVVLSELGAAFAGSTVCALAVVFDREGRRARLEAAEREVHLEAALSEAERAAEARSRFLANMSHEIRTPMNGVLGLTRVLLDEQTTRENRALAETILSSGTSLLAILDDILDLSKLDAGALEVDPKPERPARLLEQVLQLMKARADERGVQLASTVRHPADLTVKIDGHRLMQVVSNLVSNGVKFTEPGGQVRLSCHYAGGKLTVEVEDSGVGMDAKTLDRVFQPFVQAEAGTARRYGGTGLGLAISRQLMELMSGTLEGESEVGRGTVFRLTLPAPPAELASDTSPTGRPSAGLARPLRVLVAEDNRVNQMVIRRLLDKLGCDFELVDDGTAAVKAAFERTPEVIFMDIHMPGMDGIEATQLIRGAGGQMPIFALTASVMKEEREACLQAGMTDVLRKPIDFDELRDVLAGQLSS